MKHYDDDAADIATATATLTIATAVDGVLLN